MCAIGPLRPGEEEVGADDALADLDAARSGVEPVARLVAAHVVAAERGAARVLHLADDVEREPRAREDDAGAVLERAAVERRRRALEIVVDEEARLAPRILGGNDGWYGPAAEIEQAHGAALGRWIELEAEDVGAEEGEPGDRAVGVAGGDALRIDVARAHRRAERRRRGGPDGARLPLFSPVTDAIKEGIRGGALLGVYEGVKDEPSLGEGLWKKRFVIATNPFDQGRMMVKFATEDLPKFEKQHGMPMDTPLFFTEYGFSSQNLSDDLDAQAKYYGEQLSAIYASKDAGSVIFGAVAFSSEVRPWLASPEPGFGMLDFGGDTGGWNLPERNYDVKVKYWNPNGDSGKGQVWDGVYHVQRQTPRPVWKTVATSFTAREGK